jgi:hypothetical protein
MPRSIATFGVLAYALALTACVDSLSEYYPDVLGTPGSSVTVFRPDASASADSGENGRNVSAPFDDDPSDDASSEVIVSDASSAQRDDADTQEASLLVDASVAVDPAAAEIAEAVALAAEAEQRLDAGVSGDSASLDAGTTKSVRCISPRVVADADVPVCPNEDVLHYDGDPFVGRAEMDVAYASMAPVSIPDEPERFTNLPNTRALLCCKNELRVVMLGDSIVNDTSHSRWNEYLSEATGAVVFKTTSVRGSTGSTWYQQTPRVYCGALRYAPDLVVLGGISQIDIPALREVIRQIQSASSSEVLLMTPAFGPVDPRNGSQWTYAVDPSGGSVRAAMKALASEAQIGFLDMTAHWGKYVIDSGRDVTEFKRDAIHANSEGKQVMGRVLAQFLNPAAGGSRCP